jgi:flagella basal body P-ring formation protein FlgA
MFFLRIQKFPRKGLMMKFLRKISLLLMLFIAPAAVAFADDGQPGEGATPVVVDAEAIRRHLDDFIRSRQGDLPQADIRFRKLELPAPFSLPPGKLEVEVIPADPQIVTSRRFTMIFRVDSRVEKNLALRAELEAIAPVVVAAGDLGRGAVLSARDLNVVATDLVGLRNPCFDPAELVGKKLRQSVRLGAPIVRTQIDFPPLVKRGEAVTINLLQGRLLLTANGEAQQDGREGETIRVRNNSSRKEVLCRVTSTGQVQVEF